MTASDSQFRARLLGRLLRAAGASSTGLLLAAACAGRSERHEPGAGGAGASSAGHGTSGGRNASGGVAGRASGGSAAVAATGGDLFVEPADAGEPDGAVPTLDGGANMRICIAFAGQSHVVTSGTGGDAPCRSAAGGGGGLDGSAGTSAASGGAAGSSGAAGSGEGGEPSVTCP